MHWKYPYFSAGCRSGKGRRSGIFSDKCPGKYVITQRALAEGWDCSFAYVLVSMVDVKSATQVEQLQRRVKQLLTNAAIPAYQQHLFDQGREERVRVGSEYRFQFHPDFVCRLNDGRILVVEYKGSDRWDAAADDRLIGELWAEMSDGACLFVMVGDKRWDALSAAVKP